MTTIRQEGNKLQPDTYLELFDFDATMLFDSNSVPGTISYYSNTPTGGGLTPILWRTHNYFPLPFELSGAGAKGDGTAPPRPTITISNVEKVFLAAVLSLGDLIGMNITRWRTFFKFTDNGSEPNILSHYPVDTWILTKKIIQNRKILQYEMTTPLDRPNLLLPRKQVLKDLGFPGVGRIRLR